MPDFSPDYTPRYKAKYNAAGLIHTATVRGFRGAGSGVVIANGRAALSGVFTALASRLAADFAWISAQYIPEDSSVAQAAATPTAVVGTVLVNTFSLQDKVTSTGFVGRASTTPVRLFLWGLAYNPDLLPANIYADFKVLASEDAIFATAITGLNSAGLAGNNNLPALWYQYANLKLNDFWLRRVRSGGVL